MMNRFSLIIIYLIAFSAFAQGHEKNLEVSHGSQFGMCDGYCYSETIYNKLSQTKVNKAWGDTITNPKKIKSIPTTTDDWQNLVSSINLSAFFNLNERIGCPDCDDEGKVWVYIKTNKKEKRVSFEYNKPPNEIKSLTNLLNDK